MTRSLQVFVGRFALLVALFLLLAAPAASADRAQEPASPAVDANAEPDSANPAASADAEPESASPAESPARLQETFADPELPTSHLDIRLKPLNQEELQEELNGWLAVVEAKQKEIGAKEIAALEAKERGEDTAALLKETTELTIERGKLAERAALVVKAYELKGGDATTEKKYLDAVSGISFKAEDAGAMWTRFEAWATSSDGGIALAISFAKFLGVLVAFWLLSRIVASIVNRALGRAKHLTRLLREFFVGGARRLVLFIGAIIAVSMFGVDIGPLLAAIGAAGFVIGFALQDTLSNFASGLMILFYRPYDVGNFVSIAGESGTVEKMSLVSTSLRTPDNQLIVIPNNSIWGGNITNVTGTSRRRVDMKFGIGYSDDIAKAEKLLSEVLGEHELILPDPAPVIRVHELADSSVNFVVRPWVKTSDYWAVYWDITRSVKERFDQEGISIPFPQRDVHVHTVDAAAD